MATRTATRPASRKAEAPVRPKTEYGEREPGYLSGNLTRDFELRFTPTGRAVANSSVAVNERVKNPDTGEWEDTDPEYYEITVWGEQAERATECFDKGDRVIAVGFFQEETFTKRDGEPGSAVKFTARDIGPSLLFRDAVIKRPQRTRK